MRSLSRSHGHYLLSLFFIGIGGFGNKLGSTVLVSPSLFDCVRVFIFNHTVLVSSFRHKRLCITSTETVEPRESIAIESNSQGHHATETQSDQSSQHEVSTNEQGTNERMERKKKKALKELNQGKKRS